jgi:hypothetical protein
MLNKLFGAKKQFASPKKEISKEPSVRPSALGERVTYLRKNSNF